MDDLGGLRAVDGMGILMDEWLRRYVYKNSMERAK